MNDVVLLVEIDGLVVVGMVVLLNNAVTRSFFSNSSQPVSFVFFVRV